MWKGRSGTLEEDFGSKLQQHWDNLSLLRKVTSQNQPTENLEVQADSQRLTQKKWAPCESIAGTYLCLAKGGIISARKRRSLVSQATGAKDWSSLKGSQPLPQVLDSIRFWSESSQNNPSFEHRRKRRSWCQMLHFFKKRVFIFLRFCWCTDRSTTQRRKTAKVK